MKNRERLHVSIHPGLAQLLLESAAKNNRTKSQEVEVILAKFYNFNLNAS